LWSDEIANCRIRCIYEYTPFCNGPDEDRRPSGRFADFSEIGVHTCLCLKLVGGRGCGSCEKRLHLAVINGEVRARLKGRVLGPEWLKQIAAMKYDDPFTLPPDLELSVQDAKTLWPF
jgi:hypothetical protein